MYLKTKIHILRIIGYLIQFGIIFICYWFLRNHFLFMALLIDIIAPFISVVLLFVMRNMIQIKIRSTEMYERRLSTSYIELSVINKAYFMSFDVCVNLSAANSFYNSKGSTIISVPARFHGTYKQLIPVEYTRNGRYRYEINSFTVRDFLGFVSLAKKIEVYDEISVLPEDSVGGMKSLSDLSLGMTESEETKKKGHDFSDVSDVREYIPGDKLMSIHWKLSAKRDILMVKDRVSMSDQQMVMVIELGGDPVIVDQILTLAYNTAKMLIKDGVYMRLLFWSDKGFLFREREIMNLDDLNFSFTDMYFETIYEDSDKTLELMRSIHPELKSYVHVTNKDGAAYVEIIEQE